MIRPLQSLMVGIFSLFPLDRTGGLFFPVVMAKNSFRFPLPVIRFDDKVTKTERRLVDKIVAFREMWDMSIGLCKSLYLVGSAICIDEQLLLFRGRYGFRQNMRKKPNKYGIKIWKMCDCATKHMMGVKVYFGKENNEVAGGLASDADCKLVQPISGQDRGGRNVTTDNFFTSVHLANQLKKQNLDTCWDNEAKQNRNSTRVQACQAT